MESGVLILSASNVKVLISKFKPSELQLLMARVFQLVSTPPQPYEPAASYTPHRTSIPTCNHTALFMPARIAYPRSLSGTAIKVVSVPKSPTDLRGLPASTLVLDEDTGAVRAVVNATNLTALRNAAGVPAVRPINLCSELIPVNLCNDMKRRFALVDYFGWASNAKECRRFWRRQTD